MSEMTNESKSYSSVTEFSRDIIGEEFADRLEKKMKATEMTLLLECMRIKAGHSNEDMTTLMGWSHSEVVAFQEGLDKDLTYPQMAKWCEACGQSLKELVEARVRGMKCIEWQSCEWGDAEQHRERCLTGSIGLEGAWSEWRNGKPEKCLQNRQYQYRKKK